MSKVAAKAVSVDGFTINVPVGSMDKPCQYGENAWKVISNRKNWKLATDPFVTDDQSKAEAVAYTLDWYVGGHETETQVWDGVTMYIVRSKGYYYYIGA